MIKKEYVIIVYNHCHINEELLNGEINSRVIFKTHYNPTTPTELKNITNKEDLIFIMSCFSYIYDSPVSAECITKNNIKSITNGIDLFDLENILYFVNENRNEKIFNKNINILGTFLNNKKESSYKMFDFSKYIKVKNELFIYMNALSEYNSLSEYLNYSRIIESASSIIYKNITKKEKPDEGLEKLRFRKFIDDNISYIKNGTNKFGRLKMLTYNMTSNSYKNYIYFNKIRTLANKRLNYLVETKNINNGDYFYSENRCGIAHGKSNQKTLPKYFELDYENIYKDNYIMKLLARIAIEKLI